MVFFKPEKGVCDQEIFDLVTAVVKNERAPVGVCALARVGVFVEGGSVKCGQAVGVGGKVRGNPVEEDADVVVVAVVDEILKIFRCAIAAGGGEIAGDLVAPGFVEGVFHHGHQFDVGVAHFFDIGYEVMGEFPVGWRAVALVGNATPGTGVYFVDAYGASQ